MVGDSTDFGVTFIEDKRFWDKGQTEMTFYKAFGKLQADRLQLPNDLDDIDKTIPDELD